MKRTKSALSLKNLAQSIKHSIQLDVEKTAKKSFAPLVTTKSLANMIMKQRNSNMDKNTRNLNKQQKQNRIFVLEKQITGLQKQLQDQQSTVKDYSKELNQYDQITKKLAERELEISSEKQTIVLLKNQLLMLQQEIFSANFNHQERVAEKEYHQDIIYSYQQQYEAQSAIVMEILHLQEKNKNINEQIKEIQNKIEKSKFMLQKWKDEVSFQLNSHKLKNNIKIIKVKMIEVQDKCNQFCEEHNLRKIRELYCLYFKNYAKKNGVGNDEAEKGIDVFICKNNLSEDFGEFIRERLVYNKPKFPFLDQYIQYLTKMEETYKKSSFEANKKLYSYYVEQIEQLQADKKRNEQQVIKIKQKITFLEASIDESFNNQSIAVIQYLREKNENKYDLKAIKKKLRQNKKQQNSRIGTIKFSFNLIKQIDFTLDKTDLTLKANDIKQQIKDVTQSLLQSQMSLQLLQKRYNKLQRQKNQVEDEISGHITRWRELDLKKDQLKKYYKQLQQSKKLSPYQTDSYEYKITKNNNQYFKQSTKIRSQSRRPLQDSKYKNHTKNTSILSLNHSKSILTLTNPYKKAMEKEKQPYEQLLTNCQMIVSRKLTNRQNQQRQSKMMNEKNSINKIKGKLLQTKIENKQNDIWMPRNKSVTVIGPQKLSIATTNHTTKGKIAESQRQSLSKFLVSKFNR